MPRTGFEPVRISPADFKAAAAPITPSGHDNYTIELSVYYVFFYLGVCYEWFYRFWEMESQIR